MKKPNLSFLSDKQNKELILFSFLSIIVILLDFSFILKNQWAGLWETNQQLSQTRQKILKSDVDVVRIDQLKERLNRLRSAAAAVKKGIVAEEDIQALMGKISKLADKASIKIMQMIPQKEIKGSNEINPEAGNDYYIQPLSLIARGDYHSLGKFLNELEASDALINVKTIDIMPQGKAGSLKHNIRLSLFIFVAKST